MLPLQQSVVVVVSCDLIFLMLEKVSLKKNNNNESKEKIERNL
jgi:hypothetical protein